MPLNVTFDYNFNEVNPVVEGDTNSVKLTSYRANHLRRFSTPPKDCSAVEVRRLKYIVGRARTPKAILSGINMTVPEGAIYGLLGPSGSGKTTLLRTVVGQLKPSEGYVKVFGFQPNQPGSQIPGPAIGYMPQEIAVYNDFTIEETLVYFGRLYRIKWAILEERISFLLTFLDLPHKSRLLTNLSGGQKRRVSLASALVHSPPLLILDEPTVGVDPLLRQSIWQHLVTLTQTEKITVIVTTHYIEEARRANIVGLMRRGKLLAENSPEDLMARHDSDSLEDVFLKLCVSDTMRRAQKFASLTGMPVQAAGMAGQNSVLPTPEIESKCKHDNQQQSGNNNNSFIVGNQLAVVQQANGCQNNNNNINDTNNDQHRQQSAGAGGVINEGADISSSASTSSQHSGDQSGTMTDDELEHRSSNHNQTVIDIQQQQQQLKLKSKQSGVASRFALKSLLKGFGGGNNNSNAGPPSLSQQQRQSKLEARRQSGAYFMEQYLKNKFNPLAGADPTRNNANSNNNNSMVSCDTLDTISSKLSDSHLPKIQVYPSEGSPMSTEADGKPALTDKMAEPVDQYEEDFTIDPELFLNPYELGTMSPGSKYDYKQPSVKEYCDSIVVLFCICVGNDPFDVKVAVVNEESSADSIAALSSQFLRLVDSHLVSQVPYDNLDKAIESVRRGENWGAIHIPENFTISIHKRFTGIEGEIDNDTIYNSTIKVYPDMTNQPIGHAMEIAFRQAFYTLTKQTFEFIGLNPSLADPPIRMEQAIYGELYMKNYLQYMAPGVIISISYIMATGLTALAFIIERRDGLYDRTLAAGVNQVQILISHSIIQLSVMTVQISLVVFFTFVVYNVPTKGPFIWVFLLLLLQGLTGMSFGLLVSAVCEEENTAMMMILGTFYPNLLLAGVIWPIEAIPYWLRWFSYLQPQTIPTEALRNLIVRGWTITETGVWAGFAVTGAWLIFFLFMASLAFKTKK